MGKHHHARSDTTLQVQTIREDVSAAADSIRPEVERLEKCASSAAMAATRLGRIARRVRSSQTLAALTDGKMPPEPAPETPTEK